MRVFRATICRTVLSILLLVKMSVSGACCCSVFASALANTLACETSCGCCCSGIDETSSCCQHPGLFKGDEEQSRCGTDVLPGCSASCDCDFVDDALPFISRTSENGFQSHSAMVPGFVSRLEDFVSPMIPAERRAPDSGRESIHNNRQARLCVWQN